MASKVQKYLNFGKYRIINESFTTNPSCVNAQNQERRLEGAFAEGALKKPNTNKKRPPMR
jgi:hypothetical protein